MEAAKRKPALPSNVVPLFPPVPVVTPAGAERYDRSSAGRLSWIIAFDDRNAPELPSGVRIGIDHSRLPRHGEWCVPDRDHPSGEPDIEVMRWLGKGRIPEGFKLRGTECYRGDPKVRCW